MRPVGSGLSPEWMFIADMSADMSRTKYLMEQPSLPLVQVHMLTACSENVHHSFLLLCVYSLRLLPYRDLLLRWTKPDSIQLYIITLPPGSAVWNKLAEFPGWCWCIFIRGHAPHPCYSVCMSVSSFLLPQLDRSLNHHRKGLQSGDSKTNFTFLI